MSRASSIFAPTPAVAHRRRQVAGTILTLTFVAALYGGTHALAALPVLLGWCA